MAIIHVDGKHLEADGADNLLQALLSLGYDVPYFCYHPALGSVGSCRQCAVKQFNNEEDYKAGRGRLVMSCMVNPTDDMYISIDDEEAKTFRKRIVEYIITNHPHDCPTCEEGGHCHLQDMTYMSGHRQRRYRFTKRTHHNQDLGAFINHEMNRCIACYRCVRFYKDYAGGSDFGVYASNNRVYFGREADGQFDSEFSGNLTEVCPTGVFTDKTHSDRYNRKWDMQYAPSVCQGCSVGCSISAGERYGELRRIENRYNPDVNGYFLCDRGRFGYGYVNRADRPLQPLENIDGKMVAVSADFAVDGVSVLLKDKAVIGIGSARASLESNFALKKLVGEDNFSTGERLGAKNLTQLAMDVLRHNSLINVSLGQIEMADAVFVLGEDLTQTAPRVALAVRQAAKNKARQMAAALKTQEWLAEPVKRIGQEAYSPIYVAAVSDTKLDDISKTSVVATPSDLAKLAIMTADVIRGFDDDLKLIAQKAKAIFDNETIAKEHGDDTDGATMKNLAHHIAYDLMMADRPLIIGGVSSQSADVVRACAFLSTTLAAKRTQVRQHERAYIETENARRLSDAKELSVDAEKLAKPDHDELNNAGEEKVVRQAVDVELLQENTAYSEQSGIYMVLPSANSVGVNMLGGLSIEEVLAKDYEAVVILEHDLLNLSNEQRHKLLTKPVVVLDHQHYDWHDDCQYLLSAASFAEGDGTLVSAEGRAQRYFAALDKKYYQPTTDIKDSWRWLGAIYQDLNGHADDSWQHLDALIAELVAVYPELTGITQAAPYSDYRITGLKVAREPRRYSGRTAMRAKISVHEPMQPKDADSALTFSMEGYVGDKTESAVIPFAWSAGWNSPQAWNKYQDKVGGRLKGGDVGVRLFDELARHDTDYTISALDIQDTRPSSIFEGRASLVPLYQLFDSSELAYRSDVVAKQMKAQAWYIAKEDADKWLLKAGDKLAISQNDVEIVLPVSLVDYLAEGCIGYVVGQIPLVSTLPATVKKSDGELYVPYYEQQRLQPNIVPQSLSLFNKAKGRNNLGLVENPEYSHAPNAMGEQSL